MGEDLELVEVKSDTRCMPDSPGGAGKLPLGVSIS